MHEPEALTRYLVRISHRMRLARACGEAGVGAAVSAGVALLYQILAGLTPSVAGQAGLRWAAATALLIVWSRALWRMSREVSADAAADFADRQADLRDLLKSAHCFGRRDAREPIVECQMQRAAAVAGQLSPERVMPLALPRSLIYAAVLGLAALSWPAFQPVWRHIVPAGGVPVARGEGTAGAAGTARTPDAQAARRAAPERPDAAAATGSDAPVANAVRGAEASGSARNQAGASSTATGAVQWSAIQRSLKALVDNDDPHAADAGGRDADAARGGGPPPDAAGRPRAAVADDAVAGLTQKKLVATGALDLMSKLGEMFKSDADDNAAPHGEMARSLRQATLLGDKLEDEAPGPRQKSADRKAADKDEGPPSAQGPTVPLSPESRQQEGHGDGSGDKPEGNARLDAGDIPQAATATGQGDPQHQGGNDNAESKGSGPAAPVKGERTARLATQLNRSVIKSAPSQEGRDAGIDPIYSATRAQQSMLDYRTVAARAPASREDAMNGEHVPLAWRPVVREYFLTQKNRDK